MSTTTTLLADGPVSALLLDPMKPILMVATFIPWAWLISSKLDKDAAYFHLNRIMWNGWYLAGGAAAVLAMLLTPIFWIGWPVGIILQWAPIIVYWKLRNAQVPEDKRFYINSATISSYMERRKQSAATRGAVINFTDSKGVRKEVPVKDDPLYPVHLLAEDLIGPAIDARATRIELVSSPSGFVVSQVIDGVRYRRDPISANDGNLVIDYLKKLAGMDVQNRRKRQIADMRMSSQTAGTHTLSITTAGSSSGQDLRIDLDRAERMDRPIDGLGLLKPQLEGLRAFEAAHNRHGIILIGAPAGHGLTAMGYSLISRHDAYTTNVKTLEKEIMLRRDGVDHQLFDVENPDLDFAISLQSMLRRDPDVVLVGDITDKDTAKVAAEPGVEGPLIYIPQRQPGVREQIVDWVKRVGDLNRAVKPLRAVVNGRLLRHLCPSCRQPYQPTADQLKKLNLPAERVKQLYKASGKVQVKNKIETCPICQGTGYMGQVGAFEVMVLDDAARKMIINNDLQGAYTHCRRQGMRFLQEAALAKVIEGATSLDEVARVLSTAKPPTGPAPRPQPVAT